LACRVAWSACRSFPLVVLGALEEASETFEIEFRLRRVSLGLDLQRQNKTGRWQASSSKCSAAEVLNHSSILGCLCFSWPWPIQVRCWFEWGGSTTGQESSRRSFAFACRPGGKAPAKVLEM
jgi:hypothetical protein